MTIREIEALEERMQSARWPVVWSDRVRPVIADWRRMREVMVKASGALHCTECDERHCDVHGDVLDDLYAILAETSDEKEPDK